MIRLIIGCLGICFDDWKSREWEMVGRAGGASRRLWLFVGRVGLRGLRGTWCFDVGLWRDNTGELMADVGIVLTSNGTQVL